VSVATSPDLASTLTADADFIVLTNDRGVRFSLPATRTCITSFVLLEQGRWFEREVEFLHRLVTPGMIALDVGANVGVYALPFGRLAGPAGQVYAYEPSSTNRRHLERSLALNDLGNVELSALALSNFSGNGCLKLGESGELHELVAAASASEATETVEVSTLDAELARLQWPRVDFVKLDAEGQEQAILDGAASFFERYSPLVMFEVKHRWEINLGLLASFKELGFGIYRLLGDASMLVPFDSSEDMDPYELNFFAVRPEQATELAGRGLLAPGLENISLSENERATAIDAYCGLPFARTMEVTAADVTDCPYADALVAHSACRFLPQLSPGRRFALMQGALQAILDYCSTSNSPAALSSLARIAIDCGSRKLGNDVMQHLLEVADAIDQPFLPVAPRFESIDGAQVETWFLHSAEETFEFNRAYSSFFGHDLGHIEVLAAHPNAAPALLRRLVMAGLNDGHGPNHFRFALARLQAALPESHGAWLGAVQHLDAKT
jgi:FkbM family methyltransferase